MMIRAGFFLGMLMASTVAYAWSDHASLLWPLVRDWPELTEDSVTAETLDHFLSAEAEVITTVLDDYEQWAESTQPLYPPRPDNLAFATRPERSLRDRFLAALRINPRLPYRLYRQHMPSEPMVDAALSWSDLSFLDSGLSHTDVRYIEIEHGELVSPAHILASASDEPDFGMDIGLFNNNGTEFGRDYGFGEQPFGNPNLDYGSQAPFHMGFYHLDWLTRTAQPNLLRTGPLWRVALYDRLSQAAFDTGHSYWGWRFLGWALHYIGDLTQPYHALPLPGVSTPEALWLVVQGRTADAVQWVSNRHGVLESYQHQRLTTLFGIDQSGHPLIRAIVGSAHNERFTPEQLITPLALQSVQAADDLDQALLANVPARYVSDASFEWSGSAEESRAVTLVQQAAGASGIDALDKQLAVQLERFGFWARALVNTALDRQAVAPMAMPVSWSDLADRIPSERPRGIPYGDEPQQQRYARASAADATKASLLLIHGGCWSNQFGYDHLLPMSAALASEGFGVDLLEYRRVGDPGGGWPGTRDDVMAGVAHWLDQLDSNARAILVGHSAGGHLALLAAEQHAERIDAVVALAPITDLASYGQQEGSCPSMVDALMHDVAAEDRPVALQQGSPGLRTPRQPTLLVRGAQDPIVGVDQIAPLLDKDNIRHLAIAGAGHFDLVHPLAPAFRQWLSALEGMK